MLIRTQDRIALINTENMAELYAQILNPKKEIRETYKTEIKYHSNESNDRLLGVYSSKEKALKVLDMIEKAYADSIGGNVYEHSVFHMPADEEVNV